MLNKPILLMREKMGGGTTSKRGFSQYKLKHPEIVADSGHFSLIITVYFQAQSVRVQNQILKKTCRSPMNYGAHSRLHLG